MDNKQSPMIRPYAIDDKQHKEFWKQKDITILVCQRNTPELIRLCLESILRFYPDIPIVVMDDYSTDDSIWYLKYKEITNSNIKIFNWTGLHSHGQIMDAAINEAIPTKYVLTMDSDTILFRGGWIEDLLEQFKDNDNLYATGTRMYVTRSNDCVGEPKDDSDAVAYAHPSCSVLRTDIYKTLPPAANHGSPFCYNMMEAEKRGLEIGYYPIENYVFHNGGSSWQVVCTHWLNDFGVMVRPFISFIQGDTDHDVDLGYQTDHDFEIIPLGSWVDKKVSLYSGNIIEVRNLKYDIRFRVHGEYVCEMLGFVEPLEEDFVHACKQSILIMLQNGTPNTEFEFCGFKIVERKHWQQNYSIL